MTITKKQAQLIGERIAIAVLGGLPDILPDLIDAELRRREARKKRAAKKKSVRRRKPNPTTKALLLLGTPKFKPLEGLYPTVAKSLGLTRRYVYHVAKGQLKSARVMEALRAELQQRSIDAPITCTREQLTKGGEQ